MQSDNARLTATHLFNEAHFSGDPWQVYFLRVEWSKPYQIWEGRTDQS